MARILVVEDNEMYRDGLTYEISVALDGQVAVDRVASEQPDLFLTAMSLPVLAGLEATRLLKAADATKSIPINALTAHAMAGEQQKALDVGCDDYDTKPVDPKRLLEKIEAAFE